jgi:hypothetical protein
MPIDALGLSLPFFVSITKAPPSVFKPNMGLEPGNTLTRDIAFIGIRSQFTTEPKGSFIRMPSK